MTFVIVLSVILGLVCIVLGICLYYRCSWSRSGEANENENPREGELSKDSTLTRKRQLDFRVKFQTKKTVNNRRVRMNVEETVVDEEEEKEEDEEAIAQKALVLRLIKKM